MSEIVKVELITKIKYKGEEHNLQELFNYLVEQLELKENIINELENYCEEKIIEYNGEIKTIDNTMDKMNLLGARSSFNNILDKLQELKGE